MRGHSIAPGRREAVRTLVAAAAGFRLASVQGGAASSKSIVRTVLKDVPPESLGRTLFHEHLELSSSFGLNGGPGAPQPSRHFSEDMDLLVQELQAARRDGITCFVDAGHADLGRRVPYLRQLSKASGMPIVVSGGYHSQATYPPEVLRATEDDLVEELVAYAHAERWGALGEIGTSATITQDERKMLRAVGRTHLLTNLPILTHTDNGNGAIEQLDLLESVGVKPNRMVIGHLGGRTMPTIEVHKAICRRGAFVGFDRVGNGDVDAPQVPMVMQLVEAGYADKILLASDGGAMPDILKTKGGPGYARAYTVFGPRLVKAGMPPEVLERIVVENPRRLLAFIPKV